VSLTPTDASPVVLFMTDGEADTSSSVATLSSIRSQYQVQKFMFFGIGFGSAVRMSVLKELSIAANGSDIFTIGTDKFHYLYHAINSLELHDTFNTIVNCTNVESNNTLNAIKLLTGQIGNERNILCSTLEALQLNYENEKNNLEKHRIGDIKATSEFITQHYNSVKTVLKNELTALEKEIKEVGNHIKKLQQKQIDANTKIARVDQDSKNNKAELERTREKIDAQMTEHTDTILKDMDRQCKELHQMTGFSDKNSFESFGDALDDRMAMINDMLTVVEEVKQLLQKVIQQVNYLKDILDPVKTPIKDFWQNVFEILKKNIDTLNPSDTHQCIRTICERHDLWEERLKSLNPIISVLSENDLNQICDCTTEEGLAELKQLYLESHDFTFTSTKIKGQIKYIEEQIKSSSNETSKEKLVDDLEAKKEELKNATNEEKYISRNIATLLRVLRQALERPRQMLFDQRISEFLKTEAKWICSGFLLTSKEFNGHPMLT